MNFLAVVAARLTKRKYAWKPVDGNGLLSGQSRHTHTTRFKVIVIYKFQNSRGQVIRLDSNTTTAQLAAIGATVHLHPKNKPPPKNPRHYLHVTGNTKPKRPGKKK
jgi:hypothetical protein